MSRNLVETIMGAVVLGVAGYFFVTTYQSAGMTRGQDTYRVRADFSDVTGVSVGSDVRVGGVKIGTVESVGLNYETYQAEIGMGIDKRVALPVDTTAAIVGESLLGGKFISLAAGGDEAMLNDNDIIEFTQSSVSLEQLLGKFVFSGGGVSEGGGNASEEKTPSENPDDLELTLP
jgi:phospholipid/cholesterol/gamma-HCH transport system substrate-binding protein